jgi:hypothetical protein
MRLADDVPDDRRGHVFIPDQSDYRSTIDPATDRARPRVGHDRHEWSFTKIIAKGALQVYPGWYIL